MVKKISHFPLCTYYQKTLCTLSSCPGLKENFKIMKSAPIQQCSKPSCWSIWGCCCLGFFPPELRIKPKLLCMLNTYSATKLHLKPYQYIFKYLSCMGGMCPCVCHGAHVEVRGQLGSVGSHFHFETESLVSWCVCQAGWPLVSKDSPVFISYVSHRSTWIAGLCYCIW